MGCWGSKYRYVYDAVPEVQKYQAEFEGLGLLEEDVGKLYEKYREIDVDGSGSIDIAEMLVNLNLETTPFTRRVFSLFDTDNSGEIDFRECVLSLWNYCSLADTELVAFAFELYDEDASGFLQQREVSQIMRDVYGTEFNTSPYSKILIADINQLGGNVDLISFGNFCRGHTLMLFPAYHVQLTMQKFFIGVKFWDKMQKFRSKKCKGQYQSMKTFITNHGRKSDVGVNPVQTYLEKTNANRHDAAVEGIGSRSYDGRRKSVSDEHRTGSSLQHDIKSLTNRERRKSHDHGSDSVQATPRRSSNAGLDTSRGGRRSSNPQVKSINLGKEDSSESHSSYNSRHSHHRKQKHTIITDNVTDHEYAHPDDTGFKYNPPTVSISDNSDEHSSVHKKKKTPQHAGHHHHHKNAVHPT